MSQLKLDDFNKICRLCLKEDSALINIFFSEAADVISEIMSITLQEGDFLPENICIACMDKSTEFYRYKKHCETSNIKLRSVLALNNVLDIKLNDIETMVTTELKQENNQKQNNVNDVLLKNHQPEVKSDPSLNNNDGNITQSIFEFSGDDKDEINNRNVSIPFPRCLNSKTQIRRHFKDLIPLEMYNNQKNRAKKLTQSSAVDILDDTSSEQANVENSDMLLQNENIYNEIEYEELRAGTELDQTKSDVETENDKCEYCNTQFLEIQSHLAEYHPAVDKHYCYICSKLDSSVYSSVKRLQAHLKYHKQVPRFQCEICSKWFRCKSHKMVHMRLHTGERPVMCEICNKSFRYPRSLAVHSKSHTGEKPYKCSICQKAFSHKFSLKVHMKTHSAEREHMCNICGKTFVYSHNLKIHLRQHTGEKPYTCHLCFTSFISCSVLKAHMLTHSDQKRFECKACGKKFKRTGDLNVHMRSHTGEKPYACTLCSNRYKMSSHLTEHMKTHTGEKNYICEICSKSFYNNKSLQVHKNSHSGQKTYSCKDCNKSFVHHTSLCAHQKKQHKIKSEKL